MQGPILCMIENTMQPAANLPSALAQRQCQLLDSSEPKWLEQSRTEATKVECVSPCRTPNSHRTRAEGTFVSDRALKEAHPVPMNPTHHSEPREKDGLSPLLPQKSLNK
jgi:hypothetical protein